jgi:hypothetical protein
MKPHTRSLRLVGCFVALAISVTACGSQDAETTDPTSSSAAREVIGADLEVNRDDSAITFATYFTSVSDMKKQSDLVGVFEVVGSRKGDGIGDLPDVVSVQRLLELRVVEAFKGGIDPGTTVDLWNGTIEENPQTGDNGLFVTTPGWEPQIGDRVLLGLTQDERYPETFGTSSDAAYFPLTSDGSEFVQIDRGNKKAMEVQAQPVDDVLSQLREG